MITLPYQWILDYGWSIVGMNHYHVNGERYLFCAITKNGKCLKAEHKQDIEVFNMLNKQVRIHDKLD